MVWCDAMKQHARLIWGLMTAALSILGTIRTFLSASTGGEFSLQAVAYYLGAVAMFMLVAALAFIGITSILIAAAKAVLGEERGESDNVTTAILFTAGAAALWTVGAGMFSDFLIYEDSDAMGRGFGALIGIGALCTTIYMWGRSTKAEQ